MVAPDDIPRRLIVCGGRDYLDRDAVRRVIGLLDPGLTVVHGAARGADQMAATFAQQRGIELEPHPADWDRLGRGAGPLRNREMLQAGAAAVVAFKGGTGTKDMCRIAYDAGLPVLRVYCR